MAAVNTPKYDPFQSYIARSLVPTYKGESAGHEFLNGRANIEALERDASEEEVARRVAQLDWLVNSGYTLEEAEFLSAKGED